LLHLADAGELAQAFDHLGASQPAEWTGDVYLTGNGLAGAQVGSDSNRNIVFNAGIQPAASPNFRCATSATN
jgi:hypothetical protein